VAVDEHRATVLPYGTMHGRQAGEPVEPLGSAMTVPVGPALLGRVLDGLGRPMDDGPSLDHLPRVGVHGTPPPALTRPRITTPLQVGVRAIDTLLTCGRGQRVGIFAGSGVGKSSLLSMLIRGTDADVTVLALVGERGRELREFLEQDLGPEGLARSVVVVATSDEPALIRRNAAFVATRIAEDFRDRGLDVVLLMDSVTRFAMAQREIGLAAGELPATRGYPPSVFGLLPQLMERAGTSATGSITGFYTVLVEGDDLNDPIGDSARSILDGHLSLSRKLANAGHFPSLDVLQSASRVMGAVTTPEQKELARSFRELLATYDDAKDLIEVGAYAAGSDAGIDTAITLRPAMTAFLRQAMHDLQDLPASWEQLAALLAGGGR
jgi:flagellum-specific ATP synthase